MHGLFNYIASEYGGFIVSVENPDILGFLKLRRIVLGKKFSTNYNYKAMRFSSALIEAVLDTAKKLGIA